jgi:hypothetical protein
MAVPGIPNVGARAAEMQNLPMEKDRPSNA